MQVSCDLLHICICVDAHQLKKSRNVMRKIPLIIIFVGEIVVKWLIICDWTGANGLGWTSVRRCHRS